MNMTSRARLASKVLRSTFSPETASGNTNAGADVPRSSITDSTAGMIRAYRSERPRRNSNVIWREFQNFCAYWAGTRNAQYGSQDCEHLRGCCRRGLGCAETSGDRPIQLRGPPTRGARSFDEDRRPNPG